MKSTGERGFDLDIHLSFEQPLDPCEADIMLTPLLGLGLTVEYYAAPQSMIPSARLTGQSPTAAALRSALSAIKARFIEVGLRGYLRSAEGYTEWMPWRKNVILARHDYESIQLDKGVKYILE